ncbi:hypothetical protein [Flagellimonas algicola]|uniref:Peptidase T n=1 Tax=Flagellimonas algicola TaxID=2583815 RepID=A0ABY2WR58_9FLAO|nr:hypothetical protein [Allomuricauda algicola]TMU57220.1 hypothetical protein FGG15_06655 [Allomuricauda algicola]
MRTLLLLILLCSSFFAYTQQDCSLGIGGDHDEAITDVFQLNEFQLEQFKNWSAELRVRNGYLKDQAKYLLKKHAQSSPEDLMAVSYKYRDLLDSMKQNVRMLDKRLLSIFNDRQYNLYLDLCNQLTLRPIYIDRSVNEK